jgi:hypothetical protein
MNGIEEEQEQKMSAKMKLQNEAMKTYESCQPVLQEADHTM